MSISGTVEDASNTAPIILTSSDHGLIDSDTLQIQVMGVLGNTAANGVWFYEVVDADHISLVGSTGNGDFIADDEDPGEVVLSNEIQINANILYEDSEGTSVPLGVSNLLASVATKKQIATKQSIGTTEEEINLAEVVSPGWAFFINRDATNYIDLLTNTGGDRFARLQPGECAMLPLGPDAQIPFAIAHTAACQLEYLIISQ